MAGLIKKEVVVRPTSASTVAQAIEATRTFVNGFQTAPANVSGEDYINYYFADCFDARTGNIYRVFSDASSAYYGMPNNNGLVKYDLIDLSTLALKTELPVVPDLTGINNTLVEHDGRLDVLEAGSGGTVVGDGLVIE